MKSHSEGKLRTRNLASVTPNNMHVGIGVYQQQEPLPKGEVWAVKSRGKATLETSVCPLEAPFLNVPEDFQAKVSS